MTAKGMILCAVAVLASAPPLSAQLPDGPDLAFPTGLTLALGTGRYAVRDAYISGQRYTGPVPYMRTSWARLEGGHGRRMGFAYSRSEEVANHGVTTTITNAALDLDYYYRVARFGLAGRDARLYLGPSAGLAFYVNEPNVGANIFDLALSFAALVSAGANAQVTVPVSERLHAGAAVRTTLLAFTIRIVDLIEDDESPAGLLTPFSGMNATATLGVDYDLLDHLALGAGYELALLRIEPWDEMAAASDNLFLSVTVRL